MGRVSAKRRLQVRLTGNLYEAAEQVAGRSGVSLGSFIRLLVEDALATQPKTVPDALIGRGDVEGRVSILAGPCASDNPLLPLVNVLPEPPWGSTAVRADAGGRAEQGL